MALLLITCEHGGNGVPVPFRPLFVQHRDLLDTHRGWDPGALVMAEALAAACRAPLVSSTTSRLLIDLNRSLGHRHVFSPITRAAPAAVRERIVEEHYRPYRDEVEHRVAQAVSSGQRVIHISSHSFTPELDGVVRRTDVGLLYDPRRPGEVETGMRWQRSLAAVAPQLRVRRNYPYAGKADGLTSHLRKRFPPGDYVGIELEINQRIVVAGSRPLTELRRALIDSLHAVTDPEPHRERTGRTP
ncbi:N-formylglutamate amidohydrolase [Mycolicibacterium frederiksbergense]|uniref:N-formylglutamate amidohydrolase n=1 Tax=Mycolicibacterium frederiksbergense TaxID=117567 RepID=UPI00265BC9CD|nr:N-formylglutamate amidohydrolase [Mycolicibacterium frederiksbergense]MBX9921029.1 N-formylglutamate amidohydrolase [Mycolicibacterium frederiksbergense]MDO0977797.1 N-formylglutamate amidohydrolase [Mycolicibacterium frederiksbergense]